MPAAKKATTKKATTKRAPAKKAAADRVLVENVNVPGYKTTVDGAKYRETRTALLKVLPKGAPGLTQAEMGQRTAERLKGELKKKAMWWVKCVQLDLEAKGLVLREKTKPLRWHRA